MDKSLMIILAIAVLIIVIWAGLMYSKKRADAFHEFAVRRGLSFSARADFDIYEKFPEFWLFSEGMEDSVHNFISGKTDNSQVSLFDYQYKTGAGSGQMSMTHDQTVIVLGSERLMLPSFQMYPKNALYVLSKVLGRQDINFPSHPEFSKAYVLRGEDEGAVQSLFTDTVRSFFAARKGWNAEGNGERLLIYRHGSLVKPEEMQSFFSEGMEILRLFEQTSQKAQ